MGKKLKEKNELEALIKMAVKLCFDNILQNANIKQSIIQKNYFKETEKLLYAYPILKIQIKQVKLDIDDLQKEEYTGHSKDIVSMPSSGGRLDKSTDELQEIRIKNRQQSLKRTQSEIHRIDKALETIKNDEGYEIIELKYFKNMKNDEIANKLNISESTVKRWRNRLINKLKLVLFGSDAL